MASCGYGVPPARDLCHDTYGLTHWDRDKMADIFADDTFKPIFLNENIRISVKISLKFAPKVPIINIPALV